MKSREELIPAEPKIEAFLSDLAVRGKVAVSTQNQAFNALLFLYREVLHVQLGGGRERDSGVQGALGAGQAHPPGRLAAGLRGGVPAGSAGSEVPGRPEGVGMAICVSGSRSFY